MAKRLLQIISFVMIAIMIVTVTPGCQKLKKPTQKKTTQVNKVDKNKAKEQQDKKKLLKVKKPEIVAKPQGTGITTETLVTNSTEKPVNSITIRYNDFDKQGNLVKTSEQSMDVFLKAKEGVYFKQKHDVGITDVKVIGYSYKMPKKIIKIDLTGLKPTVSEEEDPEKYEQSKKYDILDVKEQKAQGAAQGSSGGGQASQGGGQAGGGKSGGGQSGGGKGGQAAKGGQPEETTITVKNKNRKKISHIIVTILEYEEKNVIGIKTIPADKSLMGGEQTDIKFPKDKKVTSIKVQGYSYYSEVEKTSVTVNQLTKQALVQKGQTPS